MWPTVSNSESEKVDIAVLRAVAAPFAGISDCAGRWQADGDRAGTSVRRRAGRLGIGPYQCPRDEVVFAIVSRRSGPTEGYLWQCRLLDDGQGNVRGELVGKFGKYSGTKEIEAIALDSQLGYVYYADELFGIRKYPTDPNHADAARGVRKGRNLDIRACGTKASESRRLAESSMSSRVGRKPRRYILWPCISVPNHARQVSETRLFDAGSAA